MVARVLTVAGSDSGGGAGIQADIKTFTALGVYGMSAITAVTVQDTSGVFEVVEIPPSSVYEQIKVVVKDIGCDSVKTGMLYSAETVESVAKAVRDFNLPFLVVDPVLRSKRGDMLFVEEACESLVRLLLPLAYVVTPNIPEAEAICECEVRRLRDVEECAKRIKALGAQAVVIKGGHLEGDKSIDLLYMGGDEFHYFVSDRIPTTSTHGTGCTFSSAIAAFLARRFDIYTAVRKAKDYTTTAIREGFKIGSGAGPLNHFWNVERCIKDFYCT